ncbi:MAG: AAA family ATPase [Verrucomicrobiales bacterium]|nr:AAA family ATPase [Verrucomicrobiales bacterium]
MEKTNVSKNPKLEISVLSTILDNPGRDLCRELSDELFTFPYSKIFPAIQALDSGKALSFVNLEQELKKAGLLESIGGTGKLKDLLGEGEIRIPGADYEYAVEQLRELAHRRAAIEVGNNLIKSASDATREFSLTECGRKLIEAAREAAPRKPFLEFRTPTECREWEMPKDYVLAGDNHLTRGGISVVGGVPGCGKSRAAVALAIAGATGEDWLGLKVHSRFKTLIIQAENGPARLKSEFSDIECPEGVNLDDWVRITPQPDFGLPLHEADFREELRNHIEELNPGVIVFDPWNRMVLDDRQKDYRAAIDSIYSCLPSDPNRKPAVVIVAHLRKQSSGEARKRGRELLPELSGSGMIGSVARSVFVLEHASPDDDDDTVVWTCAKNNDGREGGSSAWFRRNGLFAPAEAFNLEEFFESGGGGRIKIEAASVKDAVGGGVTKSQAVKRLIAATGCKDSAAYNALSAGGRFKGNLDETSEGILIWKD